MSFYFDIPIEELHLSVQRNPFEIDLWLTLINRVAKEDCVESALEEVFVAEDIFPENTELQAVKSLCLMSLGETREAYDLLQQSLRRSPGDEIVDRLVSEFLPSFVDVSQDHLFNPYALREQIENRQLETDFVERLESTIGLIQKFNESDSHPEDLVEPFERHIQNFPNDINAKLDLARLCHNIEDTHKARRFYQSVIEADPLCASAYFELATIEPDLPKAIELSEIGLQLCPRFECGRYNYATLLFKCGMLKEGRNEMLRLPADSSFYVSGLEAIANSYSEEGTFGQAAKFQEKVVTLSKNNPEAWNCYGHFFAQQGDFETALKHFDRVIELDSEHIDALHNRALMLGRLGRSEEAVHVLRYALAIAPEEESLLVNLGVELNHSGRNGEAIQVMQEALFLFPENSRMWLNLGSFQFQAQKFLESIECSRKAIEIDPDKGLAWWNIACAQALLGERDECLSALRESTVRRPDLTGLIADESAFEQYLDDDDFKALLK